ncbi:MULTISPECIES: Ycf66 family protein [unclassified Microcoleus]|uniref:Ycf66 family protein n=1 Tax=unclassified Microcoleus TaxID=2642155 RepID=UPI002FD4FCA1
MLAYILALAVGLGSFSIYMAAFFFPEVHRKSDFAWSGVGLFYALILWACAGRITGALLLGQMAGVALLGSLAWETLTLRRLVTPVAQQTPIPQAANLAGAMGAPLSGLFGKKPEPAAKKPKFVRSPKPKADAVPAPVTQGEVKAQPQPPTPPIAEIIAESAIGPDLKTPDSKTPAITEIPVFSVDSPAAETSPAPAESASNFTPLPLPLEFSEIAAPPKVEPAEAQPEAKKQTEDDDDFDEMWRSMAKDSQSDASSAAPTATATATATAAPTANPTPAKAAKKSGGFGSLFGNLKNSLGGILGRGATKNKPDANTPVTKPKVSEESIAPESKITAIPAPDIDRILESELAEVAAEVAAETSNTAVASSQAVPFPTDVEAMAELIATETASAAKIGETPILDGSPAQNQTTPLAQETPADAVGEPKAEAGVTEAEAPAVSLEMTVVEIVSSPPVEIEVPGQPGLSVQVETVSVSTISIESTEEKPSSDGAQPDLVETAKQAAPSKSENLSGEDKPSS